MRSKGQKNRFSLYISDEALDMARQWYAADNCTSMSEYIEKAVQFYSGYLATDKNENYVSDIVLSTLKGIMDDKLPLICFTSLTQSPLNLSRAKPLIPLLNARIFFIILSSTAILNSDPL